MNTEKATPELFAALAAIQGEVENASKGSVNPHFKSRYADLAEILNTVRHVCAKHGVAIIQSPGYDPEKNVVTLHTVLGHTKGGYISSTAACVPSKTDAQGVGAATTYLRRYSLAAMCGIAQEDDDGESAKHTAKAAPISDLQKQQIKDSLEELDADIKAFEKHIGCTIEALTAPQLPRVNALIDKKRKASESKVKDAASTLEQLIEKAPEK